MREFPRPTFEKEKRTMTIPQILEKVSALAQGNDIVEVYIWDKQSFAITMVDLDSLQSRLNQVSATEEVLGAIYYTGLDAPGREDFTTDPQGLKQFQTLFNAAVDNQERLRQEHGR
jgi:hypothetical protein